MIISITRGYSERRGNLSRTWKVLEMRSRPRVIFTLFTSPISISDILGKSGTATIPWESSSLLTTPFDTAGNPIPFAPGGIDTPRSFAYKMWEQYRAKEWVHPKTTGGKDLLFSTLALDSEGKENYLECYAGEETVAAKKNPNSRLKVNGSKGFRYDTYPQDPVLKAGTPSAPYANADEKIKPFLPGYYLGSKSGYVADEKTPFLPDKSAGVDSVGLLVGALSMSGIDYRILDLNNVDVAGAAAAYSRMTATTWADPQTGNVPLYGLDAEGKPVFYVLSSEGTLNSVLSGKYRLGKADLERISILVPEIRFARRGDILLDTTTEGELSLGIVVNTAWTEDEGKTLSPDELMKRITVVSVRRGFRQVTVGTWGNPTQGFGGFAVKPENYHLRRLLKMPGTTLMTAATSTDSWDLVKEVPQRRYTDYAMPWNVAMRIFQKRTITEEGGKPSVQWDITRMKQIKEHYFFQAFPPTSYKDKTVDISILNGINSMIVTCLTGWRDIGAGVFNTSYHRGLDISAASGTPILAPEAGVFWIEDLKDDKVKYIFLPNGDCLAPEPFNETYFGDITVLVTNPMNPRAGRVYLFMHQKYKADDPVFITFATNSATAKAVAKRGTLGLAGENGAAGHPHVHVEVYEYFPDFDYSAVHNIVTVNGDTYNIIDDLGNIDKTNLRWQRVDPRTVFEPTLLDITTLPDVDETARILANAMDGEGNLLFPPGSVERKKHFQDWTR